MGVVRPGGGNSCRSSFRRRRSADRCPSIYKREAAPTAITHLPTRIRSLAEAPAPSIWLSRWPRRPPPTVHSSSSLARGDPGRSLDRGPRGSRHRRRFEIALISGRRVAPADRHGAGDRRGPFPVVRRPGRRGTGAPWSGARRANPSATDSCSIARVFDKDRSCPIVCRFMRPSSPEVPFRHLCDASETRASWGDWIPVGRSA
jgi:hypothetical protein